jgi:hypothetical protein
LAVRDCCVAIAQCVAGFSLARFCGGRRTHHAETYHVDDIKFRPVARGPDPTLSIDPPGAGGPTVFGGYAGTRIPRQRQRAQRTDLRASSARRGGQPDSHWAATEVRRRGVRAGAGSAKRRPGYSDCGWPGRPAQAAGGLWCSKRVPDRPKNTSETDSTWHLLPDIEKPRSAGPSVTD